jgi:hypothetical protein
VANQGGINDLEDLRYHVSIVVKRGSNVFISIPKQPLPDNHQHQPT